LTNNYSQNLDKVIQSTKEYRLIDSKPAVQVGAWLIDNCNTSTRILQDAYAYIPSQFQNVKLLDYGDPFVQLENFHPDIIILNDYYRNYYNSFPDDEVTSANLIKAKISKSFYSFFENDPNFV
jgi:hypothetical protein